MYSWKNVIHSSANATAETVKLSAQDVLDFIRSGQNSSEHRPLMAAAFNLSERQSAHANLMSMPKDLRGIILSYALVDEDVQVSDVVPQECKEPNMLFVCHQLRDEGLPVFYAQNNFNIRVYDFNVAAVKTWLKRAHMFRSDSVRNQDNGSESNCEVKCRHEIQQGSGIAKGWTVHQVKMMEWLENTWPNKRVELPAKLDGIFWEISMQPNWANLVAWFRLCHQAEFDRYMPTDDDGPSMLAVIGAFIVVEGLSDEPWYIVEKALPGVRIALAATDLRWGD